jgi:hypothetical protein
MTEKSEGGARRVGGSPAFVAAHGIKDHSDLSFDQAYALTKLVLEERGGPVSCRGRGAVIKKPMEDALVSRGLIEVAGHSEFTQYVYTQLNIDGRVPNRIRELIDDRFPPDVKVTPRCVTERTRWVASATQAAFELVAKYLPEAT